MGMALEYLGMIPGEASGPIGILKDRIFHSGSADIPDSAPLPPYPFVEDPMPEASASESATTHHKHQEQHGHEPGAAPTRLL